MAELIDSHAHIYLPDFEDQEALVDRAHEAGVKKILMPNIDSTTIDVLHTTAQTFPGVAIPMMGLHPCSVKKDFEKELKIIEKHLLARSYIAVGEIGLDLHWDDSYIQEQEEAFKVQVAWAHEADLPIVIHSRKALNQILDILEAMALPGLRGVFHCFGGTEEQARRVIDLGFVMGIGGVVTFKNSGLAETLASIDPTHLILETDSPYLSPMPHRGKRNEPAYVRLVAQKLAEVYAVDFPEICRQTTDNATALFLQTPKQSSETSSG